MEGRSAKGPRMIHLSPGRARVALEGLHQQDQQGLVRHACHLRGVRGATLHPLTGNVLILFDPALTDGSRLIASLRAVVPACGPSAPPHGHSLCACAEACPPRDAGLLARAPMQVAPSRNLTLPLHLIKLARLIASVARFPGVQQLLRLALGPVVADVLISVADLACLLVEHGARRGSGSVAPLCDRAPRLALAC